MMIRIGIDTGGTFTDFVVAEGENVTAFKLPSTPDNPARAILTGLEPYMDRDFELIHGTTVSTNAFLQKKMAPTAFICTKGFEHILYIGRQNRTEVFSLRVSKPSPIVPLSLCFGVGERTRKDGTIMEKVREEDIISLAEELKKHDVRAVGIVFLHSYKNPENERLTAGILREYGFHVTASHEIMPEYREYERAVVTVLNSALKPVVADYVDNLKGSLGGHKLSIIQSNGGVLPPERIVDEPIRTIMSGPAGGVIAAKAIAGLKQYSDLITLDMGGTSTDVSVIKKGRLSLTRGGELECLPLRLPMIDIATVGAGGGSIASVDRGGVLRVGPESAGAEPGPACYGQSELATVTDAFVVTGAIIPEMFLGGKMKIHPKRSVRAVKAIADRIGKNLFETADGMIRISISAMGRALRSVTIEKGEDPRFYTLMPFGGAGALAAALLADKVGIGRILVPPNQGVFSAMGMLVSHFKKEMSRSFLKMYSPDVTDRLDDYFSEMTGEAREILAEEGFPEEHTDIRTYLDIRYKGQSYELTVSYHGNHQFIRDFHRLHRTLYAYSLHDGACEIVNLRVLASGKKPPLKLEKKEMVHSEARVAFRKQVYFKGEFQQFLVYRREELEPGYRLQSPCIVVADDSTIIVPRNFNAGVDEYANILLQADGKQRQNQ